MDADKFADQGIVADDEIALAALVGLILRGVSDHGMRMNLAIATDGRMAGNVRVGIDFRARADLHGTVDDRVGPDRDIRRDLGPRIDDGSFVNHDS